MTEETKELLEKIKPHIKNRWEVRNLQPRYYLRGHYLEKAAAYFTEEREREKYIFQVPGGYVGCFRVYNGAVRDELTGIFGAAEIVR